MVFLPAQLLCTFTSLHITNYPLASEFILNWVEICFIYTKHIISQFYFRKLLILQILATAQNHHSNVSFQCIQFNIQHYTHTKKYRYCVKCLYQENISLTLTHIILQKTTKQKWEGDLFPNFKLDELMMLVTLTTKMFFKV